MAISKSNFEHTFNAGSGVATTTSQYRICGMQPGTSTAADFTVALWDATTTAITITARNMIGVIQTYQSAGSADCGVMISGIAKITCAEAISAGALVVAYEGASTTTHVGHIAAADLGVTTTSVSTTAYRSFVGRALESGTTNTVISVLLNPSINHAGLVI